MMIERISIRENKNDQSGSYDRFYMSMKCMDSSPDWT